MFHVRKLQIYWLINQTSPATRQKRREAPEESSNGTTFHYVSPLLFSSTCQREHYQTQATSKDNGFKFVSLFVSLFFLTSQIWKGELASYEPIHYPSHRSQLRGTIQNTRRYFLTIWTYFVFLTLFLPDVILKYLSFFAT